MPEASEGAVPRRCGSEVIAADVVVFPSGSEMEFLTTENVGDHATFLSEKRYQEMSQALFPDRPLFVPGSATNC